MYCFKSKILSTTSVLYCNANKILKNTYRFIWVHSLIKVEELQLLLTRRNDTLSKPTTANVQESLDFKLTKSLKCFPFDFPLELQDCEWMFE